MQYRNNNNVIGGQLSRQAEQLLKTSLPLKNDRELLNAAVTVYQIRKTSLGLYDKDSDKKNGALDSKMNRWFIKARRLHSNSTLLGKIFRKHRLNNIEQEIFILMTLHDLGLCERTIRDIEELQNFLDRKNGDRFRVLEALLPTGRLEMSGLIFREEKRGTRSEMKIDPAIKDALLNKKTSMEPKWVIRSEEDLYFILFDLSRCYKEKVETLSARSHGWPSRSSSSPLLENTEKHLWGIMTKNPKWKICKLLKPLSIEEKRIVLFLLCSEFGYYIGNESFTDGMSLARVVSSEPSDVPTMVNLLRDDQPLRTRNIIQAVNSIGESKENESRNLSEHTFAFTDETLAVLNIGQKKRCKSRDPKVKMNQLVLSDDIHQALETAIVQTRHYKCLFEDWGLKESIGYGRGVTLLFSGPPGVGKTACAEAIAHEIKKPILVADYSKIHNCFVGETDKNICKTFLAARAEDAVLFWDEADAMFFDRDSADRNWEIRAVNILLQELEKFEGVCILSTNRKIHLDKALERRITMKLDFRMPDETMLAQIFEKLIPNSMPLEDDVSFEKLDCQGLSGGNLKNIVLNAARKAILRGCDTRISVDDFRWAIDKERHGHLCEKTNRPFGFCTR